MQGCRSDFEWCLQPIRNIPANRAEQRHHDISSGPCLHGGVLKCLIKIDTKSRTGPLEEKSPSLTDWIGADLDFPYLKIVLYK